MEQIDQNQLPPFPEPYWRDHINFPEFNSLKEDLDVDVVIVGGGITGITAAYLLTNEGKKVALLEADQLLNGTTGHTTAKITAQHGLIYDELISHMGQTKARLYYEAATEAKGFIQNIVEEYNIECDFKQQDAIMYATSEQYADKLEKEYEAYQKLNIEGELLDDIPFNIPVTKALAMGNQAQFHPLQYLLKLVSHIQEKGGKIFEKTVAVNVETQGDNRIVHTRDGHRVNANHVLACTHIPFYEGKGLFSTRMYVERSYLLAIKPKTEYPGGMYLNVDTPSRTMRSVTIQGEDMVIVGGENHKTGQGKDTLSYYESCRDFADQTLGIEKILYRWSAQDFTTLDKVPYIGKVSADEPQVLVATGYRKWGMTNGTIAGIILSDLVLGKSNRFEELYSPQRLYADPSIKEFLSINADVAGHLISGKFQSPPGSVEDLARDEGAVVSINGKRKGAYRDQEGTVHVVDTTCTHLGCEVEWNHGDRTWDCPCHGSRFSYEGGVIDGPAEKPLQKEDYDFLDTFTSDKSGY
ncbi:FAD-dependent oxidoreductase [Caldalkalibacillus salinus]|uniref:FAD-dependent oxidoreductase n=1 Tax=Caldalkalibacillus salinus TaxID=2803787 RepID=UPI001922AA52|nr:FAD-dependent oxidoreductase [Caldalkalibacillus salinus]